MISIRRLNKIEKEPLFWSSMGLTTIKTRLLPWLYLLPIAWLFYPLKRDWNLWLTSPDGNRTGFGWWQASISALGVVIRLRRNCHIWLPLVSPNINEIQWYKLTSVWFNTLRPRQNGRRFADDTFKRIFLNEKVRISIKISLRFVHKGQINNIPALVQIMAWRRPGDKPLSEPMMVSLLTHICVTRPQWVKSLFLQEVADFTREHCQNVFIDITSICLYKYQRSISYIVHTEAMRMIFLINKMFMKYVTSHQFWCDNPADLLASR